LRLLVRNLKAACKKTGKLSKYLNQLVILARLRKLDELTIKITTEMPINYDVETDFLYRQGIEKGIEKEREKAQSEKVETAKKMLLAGLTEVQVSDFLELPDSVIKTIKKNLGQQN
jgi:hypothetical protein